MSHENSREVGSFFRVIIVNMIAGLLAIRAAKRFPLLGDFAANSFE